MIVRLGIVAPRGARATFEQAASGLTGLEPHWMLYDTEQSVPAIVSRGAHECDALCFSGEMPYERSRDIALPSGLPITVVRLSAVDLTLCLLRARDLVSSITPLSVDTVSAEIIDEITDQLRIDRSALAHLPHRPDLGVDEVVAFHQEAHRTLGTAIAITGRSNAFARLSEQLHIPVLSSVPLVSSIRSEMNRAILAVSNRRHADKSFAAAIARVTRPGDLIESESRRLALARALHDVAELSEAWVEVRSGGQDVLVFGHRRLMQKLTQDWTAMPLVHALEAQVGQPVAIGIGLGGSARRSMEYAESALSRAERAGSRCGFVVSDEGVAIGPLTGAGERSRTHQFRLDDITLARLAKDIGFGVATVSQLLALEDELNGATVSASDLAKHLMLSPPSGRRIARALNNHGLLVPAGVTQPTGRGRPRALFRLNIRRHLNADAPQVAAGDATAAFD